MNILLDTCTFIWAVSAPDSLSDKARDEILQHDRIVYFSPITCAEIACLADRKRIELNTHWKTWFDKYIEQNGWQSIDISVPIIQDAFALPGDFYADPADRIIVATARTSNLNLITADHKILEYPFVNTLW